MAFVDVQRLPMRVKRYDEEELDGYESKGGQLDQRTVGRAR